MSESETLPEGDPLKPLTEYRFACKIEGCANFGLSIGEHPELYGKYGYYKKPENRIYRCKACLRHILVSHKVPMRRTVEGAGRRGTRKRTGSQAAEGPGSPVMCALRTRDAGCRGAAAPGRPGRRSLRDPPAGRGTSR